VLHGFEVSAAIKDYDLVYFDAADLRIDTEREIEPEVADRLRGRGTVVDVKNEAGVHLWYQRRFGHHLEPYRSTGDAIATWPTTASSVGVRYDGHTFVVCAPFGLADLSSMVARANKDDRDQRRLRGEGRPLGRTMAPNSRSSPGDTRTRRSVREQPLVGRCATVSANLGESFVVGRCR
jgi:hypothetical protein